jgi:hypothetical protein
MPQNQTEMSDAMSYAEYMAKLEEHNKKILAALKKELAALEDPIRLE